MPSRPDAIDMRPALLAPEILPLFSDPFVRSCDLFEEYVYRLSLDVFRRTDLEAACAAPATVSEVVASAGLDPEAAPVPVDWILRELALRGALSASRQDGAVRYRLERPLPAADPEAVRAAQAAHDPSALPSYAIAALAAEHYPAVLRGETTGERVLFAPERIGSWFEYFSNDNVLYAISNAIDAIACEGVFPADGGAILELGGGLGSGAFALLDRLHDRGRGSAVTAYRFTEISIPFLRRAQKLLAGRLPGAPIAYARLDMNRPFAEGGVDPGAYALVHGVNTLHVAADLAFTLGEIRTALAPGGAIVIGECIRPFAEQPVYVEFVFNLLAAFRKPVLVSGWRPAGGFLTPEQWTAALTANGFRDVRIVPDIRAIREHYPSFVVAAATAVRE
jgi:rhizoxin synthesis polyketide synthase/nonribosomal peptide synthetase RhiB